MKLLLRVMSAVLIVGAVVMGLRLLRPDDPPPKLPSPNGYDDFLRAVTLLGGSTNKAGDRSAVTEEMLIREIISERKSLETLAAEERSRLGSFVADNGEAIATVRTGLTHECRVPLRFTQDYAAQMSRNMAGLKRLSVALMAAGRLAELEQRTNISSSFYLDTMRLGQRTGVGGLLIDRLVSSAIESSAQAHFRRVIPGLGAAECREAIRLLEEVPNRESLHTTYQRDKKWAAETWGVGPLRQIILGIVDSGRDARARAARTIHSTENGRSHLLVLLAVRAHVLDHGREPGGWNDLVPAYLRAIPTDAATGQALTLP